MFKTDKVVFKKLNKMPINRRIEVASSPQGSSVLAALTPTQFAELFPRHYQRSLPDVGGFRAATTAAAQKRQAEASAGILDRLTKAEKGAEAYASQVYHQLKRKLGLEVEKQPELSREADEAFAKLRSGPIAVSSDEGKIFSRLDDKKLESVGITKTKDNTGKDVYQYTQPQVGVEEAKARLSSGSGQFTGREKAVLDMIAQREGATNPNTIFGDKGGKENSEYRTQVGMTKTLTEMTINEVLEMQKRLTSVTAANRVAGGKGTSAVGSGQMVRQTLLGNLRALGIPEGDWGKIKFDHTLQQRLTIQNFKDTIGDPNNPKSWNLQRLGAQYESFDVSKGHSPLKTTELSAVLQASTDKPIPAGKEFGDKEINKMMDQLRDEKNVARKQQLANLLTGAGVDTAIINSISNVKTSGVSGEHFGKNTECVALSKHFAPGLGPASGWKFHEGTSGIVPGAVIATRSYGHGPTPGGARFDQMPDKKSHYHTGIALTRPDAKGEVLIFDQSARYGSKITKVNINDYNGEKWGAVVDGEPTKQSMEAVNIALSRANSSEQAAINESMRGEVPKKATSTGEIKAVVDVGPPPTKPVDQEGNPIPPQAHGPMQQPGAPQEPTPQVKADAPPPAPKIQPTKFLFNKNDYLKEVATKHSVIDGMFASDEPGAMIPSRKEVWRQTVQGLKDAEAKGVIKYNEKTGELIVNDMKHPEVQKILKDMQDNQLDRNTFMKQIEEKKVETKPKEQAPLPPPPEKKVEAPTPTPEQTQNEPATIKKFVKGDGYAGMVDVPNPKYVAPKAETPPAPKQEPPAPKVEAKPQEPPKVPGASDGGSFDLAISPMDRRDNKAVIDTKTQQPLFTVKSGERINVTPQQKVDGIAPAQDNIRNEINTLRQEISSSFADAGGKMSPMQMTQIRSSSSDNPNFVDRLTKQNVDLWNNPVMERAMNRTRLQETGDSLNNHFSYGNTNG